MLKSSNISHMTIKGSFKRIFCPLLEKLHSGGTKSGLPQIRLDSLSTYLIICTLPMIMKKRIGDALLSVLYIDYGKRS